MSDVTNIVFRTLAVTAAVSLAALLLAPRRRSPAGLPGAMFCLAVAAFFVTSARGAALGPWVYPLTAICVTKAVWFWLFSRHLFNENAALKTRQLLLAGAVALLGAWQQLHFLSEYRMGSAAPWEIIAGFGVDAVLLIFVVAGFYEAWRDLQVDLVERRRRLRYGFILLTGAYLTATLAVQTFNLLKGVSTPMPVTWVNMGVVVSGCVVAAWFLLQFRSESWLDPLRPTSTAALTPAEASLLVRLQRLLESERIHLEQGLTIGQLAQHLSTGEHLLRRVINHGMGHRNFNDFLHHWRIREACDELTREEQAKLPILSVAMKVGYGSIGAFNRAFKARVGMTPTDYRRRNPKTTSPAH